MSDQQKYINKLRNARILLIGGTSGIGFAVAEAAVENGAAAVILSSSNPDKISKAVSRLKTSYPSRESVIAGAPCDLGDPETTEAKIQALLKFATDDHTKKLDHVVFTAANALLNKPLVEITPHMIRDHGYVRFIGITMLAKHLQISNALTEGSKSSLTLTTGLLSQRPMEGYTVNAAYGAALHGLTMALALEMKPARVNLVSPGAVQTEMWDRIPPERKEMFEHAIKLGTTTQAIAQPHDVAEAYMYSMKDSNVTGSVLSTNGGSLLLGKGL